MLSRPRSDQSSVRFRGGELPRDPGWLLRLDGQPAGKPIRPKPVLRLTVAHLNLTIELVIKDRRRVHVYFRDELIVTAMETNDARPEKRSAIAKRFRRLRRTAMLTQQDLAPVDWRLQVLYQPNRTRPCIASGSHTSTVRQA